jgi:nitrate reductase (cytochrome), electron transfer subunit
MRGENHARAGALGMKKSIILLAGALLVNAAWSAQPVEFYDPMRGDVPLTEEPRPVPMPQIENKDVKRGRAYTMQPPTIPHKIDNYQVDRYANKCLTCHSRTRAPESQAPMVSITHYQDRDGNFLADVAPRRYFCEQCHVPQVDAKPLVENTFQDVETLIKRGQAATARKDRNK